MRIWLMIVIAVSMLLYGRVDPSRSEMSPKEILERADQARGNLEGVEWRVYIDSIENARRKERNLNVKARGYDFLAVISSPPKVKGQMLLSVKRNMWFVKPGLSKPVPVSPRQKLVGGASYGDIAATNYAHDYSAISLTDESVNGESCYVFDLRSASKKTTYDRIKYWVSKERLVGVKAEFYTVSGKLLKQAAFEHENRITLRSQPHPFISKMTIIDAIIRDNVTKLHLNEPKLARVPASALDLNVLMR